MDVLYELGTRLEESADEEAESTATRVAVEGEEEETEEGELPEGLGPVTLTPEATALLAQRPERPNVPPEQEKPLTGSVRERLSKGASW